MRFVGQLFVSRRVSLARVTLGLSLCSAASLAAQTAPIVLPYTMSTYAGPNAPYTPGAKCSTNSSLVALDVAGDGCPATSVSVGGDPHDVRVDARGNVFYIDNSNEQIHRITPQSGQQTVYAGRARTCASTDSTNYGDGCVANDGAANNNSAVFPTSSKFPTTRGLGIAPNGDLFAAGYNSYDVFRIPASTLLQSIVAGGAGAGATSSTPVNGTAPGTAIGSTRGVGVDAAGNVYIADTGSSVIQEISPAGQMMALTASNYANTKNVTSGVPASGAQVEAPEDVQVDANGNIYIADAGNNVIRAIYEGKGTLPGIVNPVTGYIYTIAGGAAATAPAYPANAAAEPTVPATSIVLSFRHIALDSTGNLYIADTTDGYIWFVDATTGYIRLLAGDFAAAAPGTALGCPASKGNSVGDGCPGPYAELLGSSNTSIGLSPDSLGNLYISDPEGGNSTNSRIRKLLSGLNFPAVAVGSSATQTVQVHFVVNDKLANALFPTSDFSAGTPTCTQQADNTYDCLIPITFKPSVAGFASVTFSVTSALGGTANFVLTGTGAGPAIAIDPGYVTSASVTVKNAQGVATDRAGNVYTADTGNNRVLLSPANGGSTVVFAGTGTAGYSGDGGAATAATLKAPTAVAADSAGNIYITDTGNNVIRRVNAAGVITTFAGGGSSCAVTANACAATSTSFSSPSGIATDTFGQVYVADTGNNLIRQISTSGFVYLLAGGGTSCGTVATDAAGDGCAGAQGIFSAPYGLAYDTVGDYLLVADSGNNIVRRISLANAITATSTGVATAVMNPLSLVAGNLQAGTSVSATGAANDSQLNAPRGVAVDANEDTVIADTGNSAIRFVDNTTGTITTIGGLLGTSGAGAVPGSATTVQLSSPTGVALSGGNNILIADSGNSRVLIDNRSQVTYNFGRVNEGTSSPAVVFTETNTGSGSETFLTPFDTMSGSTDFTLTASGSSLCTANSTLTVGATCTLSGMYTPTTTGTETAVYTENTTLPVQPSITLTAMGAVLTKTTSTLAQTSPATGNPQYGGSFVLTATVTATACNTTGAPACYPTGTVTFSVDGATFGSPVTLSTPGSTSATSAMASQTISGLSTGTHTATCYYSGDAFYGASSCGSLTITVAQASTTSTLTAATSGAPQYPTTGCVPIVSGTLQGGRTCVGETLTATVVSNTSGVPTGGVTFYNGSKALGTTSLSSAGIATLALTYTVDKNNNLYSDSTLPVGTYTLSCTYLGAANYATSNCAGITFTVAAQTAAFTLTPRGCILSGLNGLEQGVCSATNAADVTLNGYPVVATADGSTTDATIFINPSNTLTGSIGISCSGLPAYSICTFSPSVASLSASATYAAPFPIDVTLWTDIRPGNATSSLHRPELRRGSRADGIALAMLLGWPLTLLGVGGLIASRRKRGKLLPWLAALLLMAGSVTAVTGCAGPGVDKVVLTPAGTYPITVTVTIAGVTQTTTVYFKVSSPGIAGQQ